jgi:hypothetical protein
MRICAIFVCLFSSLASAQNTSLPQSAPTSAPAPVPQPTPASPTAQPLPTPTKPKLVTANTACEEENKFLTPQLVNERNKLVREDYYAKLALTWAPFAAGIVDLPIDLIEGFEPEAFDAGSQYAAQLTLGAFSPLFLQGTARLYDGEDPFWHIDALAGLSLRRYGNSATSVSRSFSGRTVSGQDVLCQLRRNDLVFVVGGKVVKRDNTLSDPTDNLFGALQLGFARVFKNSKVSRDWSATVLLDPARKGVGGQLHYGASGSIFLIPSLPFVYSSVDLGAILGPELISYWGTLNVGIQLER